MALAKISRMTDADHALVTAAVAEAERHTDGEIVTIVTDLSDSYADIALLWTGLGSLLALTLVALFPQFYMGLFDHLSGGWNQNNSLNAWLGWLTIFVAIKWLGIWLILLWSPLRLALTPGAVKARRVRERAIMLFKVGTESKTVGRTGILLYLSLREHRADIVADAGIASKVGAEIWGAAMEALIDHVRAGRPGEGMAEAVRQMGEVLATHFPRGSENPNELPDRLIEL